MRVIKMVPTCSYDPLQLICLDPNELVDPLVAPQLQTLSPQLHSAPGHPQEDQAVILKVVMQGDPTGRLLDFVDIIIKVPQYHNIDSLYYT